MILPAALDALLDRRLSRGDLRVYGVVLRECDPLEFRPVKLAYVAHVTGMRKHHASRALRHLVLHGYLARGPRSDGVQTYRPIPTLVIPQAA